MELFLQEALRRAFEVPDETTLRLGKTYWVPAKAKKRKEVVPTNSPITATKCPRVVGGRVRRRRRTGPSTGALVGALVFMMEGKLMEDELKGEKKGKRLGWRWRCRSHLEIWRHLQKGLSSISFDFDQPNIVRIRKFTVRECAN